jgi:general secretion pathway protein F
VSTSFDYRALDKAGADVRGRLEAAGDVEALRLLTAQGLTPLEVSATRPNRGNGLVRGRRAIKLPDLTQLLQEMATLLKGGVPLGEVLPSLAVAYRATPLGDPLSVMDKAVRGGRRLSEAVAEAALPLPRYAHAVIQAGEASGHMAAALEDVHRQMAYDEMVRKEVRQALTYPAILVFAGMAAILIVFIAVVPRFAGLLRSSRAQVPDISRWVIELGVFAKDHWLWLAIGFTAIVGSIVVTLRQPEVRMRILEQLSTVPLIRNWIWPTEIGRWATLLATLLANRVALLEALRLSRDLTALPSLQRHLENAVREVRRGRALSAVFGEQGWLGPTQINLIRVGERSGELPRMLRSLGELQTARSRDQVKRLLSLLEPIAILVIGAVIGFVMVAVMLAITSLNTSVG